MATSKSECRSNGGAVLDLLDPVIVRKWKRPLPVGSGRHGGAKRSRTADLLNAIQALYQLSYSPEVSGLWRGPAEEARNLV